MNDKTALWLYEISSDYRKPQWLRDLVGKFLPRCEYRHWETHAECYNAGTPCWLPSFDENEDDHIEWICPEHVEPAGFCVICHTFNAGIESFEFLHPGYCDNCNSELESEREREEFDEWEDFENEYEIGYP